MIQADDVFLPGVPQDTVLRRLDAAGGNEVSSGKLSSPESSAALAVNTFGWFIERPDFLPRFPGLEAFDWPAQQVDVEFCARFPWSGGKHPWLDVLVESTNAIIGVESKRFEPFRDRKNATFSTAYDRAVWHDRMGPFEVLRDRLRSKEERFCFLDAVQLVKHAFGLVTEGRRRAKAPHLLYLFAEPVARAGIPITDQEKHAHRSEIAHFGGLIEGAEVKFHAMSYQEWFATWPTSDNQVADHLRAVVDRFAP